MQPDNILGQEVAYLMALLSLRSRSTPAPNEKDCHAYLVSWHHLTCYMTRIETTYGKVASLAQGLSSTQSEPFKVYRSRPYDMMLSEERLEFLSAIMSAMVDDMSRFGSMKREIKKIYNAVAEE